MTGLFPFNIATLGVQTSHKDCLIPEDVFLIRTTVMGKFKVPMSEHYYFVYALYFF